MSKTDEITVHIVRNSENYTKFSMRQKMINSQLECINDIIGVEYMIVDKYSILVEKGVLYKWDEMIPQISEIMQKQCTGGQDDNNAASA